MVIHHPETDMRSQSNNSQTDGFTKKLYSKKYSKCPSQHIVKKVTALTRLGKGKSIYLFHQKTYLHKNIYKSQDFICKPQYEHTTC